MDKLTVTTPVKGILSGWQVCPSYPEVVQAHNVAGYEHIDQAAELLKDVVEDLFLLPTRAQERAIGQREALGDDHGDDLDCGCWAAANSATSLLQLAGRHMDAVVHLAAVHPGFAPSASVLGRAALEALLRVRWLVDPATAVEREQRWIALRSEEVRFYKNCGVMAEADAAEEQTLLKGLSDQLGGLTANVPSAESLAREFSRSQRLYNTFYRWNSQPTHGTLVGAGSFDGDARQQWYAGGGEGEWIEAEFWGMPFIACWEGAELAMPAYRDLLVPDHPLPSLDRAAAFKRALQSVPANYQARLSAKKDVPPKPNRAQRREMQKRRRR